MKLLFPGHNYLGPGNPLDNGPSVDNADEIAREHDYSYENARSSFDIHKSDLKAIGQFGYDFVKDPNLASASGFVGLGAKKYLETYTGLTYPFEFNPTVQAVDSINTFFGGDSFLPDPSRPQIPMPKRENEDKGPDRHPNKVQAGDSLVTGGGEGGEAMSVDQKPQAGSSMPGGTGSDVMATIIKNPHLPTNMFSFKKTWQLYTGGFQFNQVDIDTFFPEPAQSEIFGPNVRVLITPLACLDPNMLPFYVSEQEYEELPSFSVAKACKIKVTPLGYRLPFQTNEASAGYANSQTLVQIAHSVGLNTMYNLTNTNYTINAADPTLVTTALAAQPDYVALLYGDQTYVGGRAGRPVHLNQYTGIIYQSSDRANAPSSTPNLLDNIQIQNVNDCKGTPIINYQHEFKNGLLKMARDDIGILNSQRQALFPTVATRNAYTAEGVNHVSNTSFSANTTVAATDGNVKDDANRFTNPSNIYQFNIEKSQWMQNQIAQHQTPDWAPMVHFGCMPVPSNFALSPAETYAAAVVQWQVECELLVECNLNSIMANDQIRYIKSYDPIFRNDDNYNKNWGRGIYVCNRRTASNTV